jgi:hypothetical protein
VSARNSSFLKLKRSSESNAATFSHVQARLNHDVLVRFIDKAGANGATGNTAGNLYRSNFQVGANTHSGRLSEHTSVLEEVTNRVKTAAIELFADKFVGTRIDYDPNDDSGSLYTIWVEVKQPAAVGDEVAMEDSFYSRIAKAAGNRVNALLEFRSA